MAKLHFEVTKKNGERCDHPGSVRKPKQYPCFALVFNYDWNDYDYYTWFGLHYFPSADSNSQFIGELKMMCVDKDDTYETLPSSFDGRLNPNRYCSLGIDVTYYQGIRDKLKPLNLDNELLVALCDCTYDVNIYERFNDMDIFKRSLLRDLRSEKALSDAKFLLSGINPEDAYSFSYRYSPKFDNSVYTQWKVTLHYKSLPYLRSIGVIGENGVGKTQMLSQMVDDFLTEGTPNFEHEPLFSSIIVICSTPLDQYTRVLNKGRRRKPFAYRCLSQKPRKTAKRLLVDIRSINESNKMMGNKSLMRYYVDMIDKYLGNEAIGLFTNSDKDDNKYSVSAKKVRELTNILSSGQLHIFQLITGVFANIHMSSLLIIDEPEVHLHPRFIMEFMVTLGNILSKFDSFAVIATHSPLIIREIVGSHVYLMKRVQGNIPHIAPVGFETFGEDATKLYRRIFEYDERESYFTRLVKALLSKKDYNKVVSLLNRDVKLGMNAQLAIRDIWEEVKGGNHA